MYILFKDIKVDFFELYILET